MRQVMGADSHRDLNTGIIVVPNHLNDSARRAGMFAGLRCQGDRNVLPDFSTRSLIWMNDDRMHQLTIARLHHPNPVVTA